MELRLKDIEWVEKHLDGLKRSGRALNNTSMADRAKKEEIASYRLQLPVGISLILFVGYCRESPEDYHHGRQGRPQRRLV